MYSGSLSYDMWITFLKFSPKIVGKSEILVYLWYIPNNEKIVGMILINKKPIGVKVTNYIMKNLLLSKSTLNSISNELVFLAETKGKNEITYSYSTKREFNDDFQFEITHNSKNRSVTLKFGTYIGSLVNVEFEDYNYEIIKLKQLLSIIRYNLDLVSYMSGIKLLNKKSK
jgi:hypothetical protein